MIGAKNRISKRSVETMAESVLFLRCFLKYEFILYVAIDNKLATVITTKKGSYSFITQYSTTKKIAIKKLLCVFTSYPSNNPPICIDSNGVSLKSS